MALDLKRNTQNRDRSLPKGRQVDEAALSDVRSLLGDLPIRRDLLIEALHLIQDGRGYLSAENLAALAEIFRLSQVEVFEVASFYHHFDVVKEGEVPPAPLTIRVCDGLSCAMSGADGLLSALGDKVDPNAIRIQPVPCIGRCQHAPAAVVGKNPVDHATPETVLEIAEAGQTEPDLPAHETLSTYQAAGGYSVLTDIRNGKISPDSVIDALEASGLRGMGGAGFPASRKWQIVRGFDGPRLMTVNADEGEPGTFKDRFWLESHPHRMLEGALIGATVVGCEKIYIYLRDEYPAAREVLLAEIAALKAAGLTGDIDIELRRGAGAYICGEESAMLESIEGKRGLPRHRPPYIAETGLFGKPTLNHNVETLSWVPDIVKNGGDWFADQGAEGHKGPRSFSVSGRVADPGVKIAPAGITLQQLIDEYCGGMAEGHTLKAFLPGGASGGIFPASMADLPLDFGSFEPHGGFVGSHAVVILSEADSIKEAALNTMRFFKHESCGQCTPCRVGTQKMVGMLQDPATEHELYNDLMTVMGDSSICGLGQAAANCVRHLMTYFPEEMA